MKSERNIRILATVVVCLAAYNVAKGPSRSSASPLSMDVVEPSAEHLLAPGQRSFSIQFEGGPMSSLDCGGQRAEIPDDGRVTVSLRVPNRQGLWILKCSAGTVDGHEHHFKRAFLVGSPPDPAVRAPQGVLRLPQAFFSKGCSNFLSVLEQRINRDVVPKLEAALRKRVTVVDDTHVKVLKTLLEVEKFRLSDLRLEVQPVRPDELRVRIHIDEIGGYGYLEVGTPKMPLFGSWSYDFEGDISGRGWIETSITVSRDKAGHLVTSVVPNTFRAEFQTVCFRRLCFALKRTDRFQLWLNRKLSTRMPGLIRDKLNQMLQNSVDHLDWEPEILGRKVPLRIQLDAMKVGTPASLDFLWHMEDRDRQTGADGQTMEVLSWAGPPPVWGGSRAHLMISDRMVNALLISIWLRILSKDLPEEWLKRLNPAVEQSGYSLVSMRFGLPPVLAPGPAKDTLRLLLGDVVVELKEPGERNRILRIHAELPVRAVPNAAFSSINFVGAYSFREDWEGPGERARDDGIVHVECSEVISKTVRVPCAKETRRFQKMLDLGLSLAKGARSHLDVPVVGPTLPGMDHQDQKIRITGIQLVPESTGWMILELDY